MSKICDLMKKAKRLGISVKTLHRRDESGKLQAKRTLSNHRYYTEDDLAVALGFQAVQSKRRVIVYCRVSSPKQKTEQYHLKLGKHIQC
jgi:putative resolvase